MDAISLQAWVVSAMVALAPPGRPTFISAAQESKEQGLTRFNAIAGNITTVALDPKEEPIGGRKFTAALLVSLTFHESAGWRRDVDLDLDRLRLAQSGWQDNGKAWCLGQIELGLKLLPGGGYTSGGATPEGWSGPELIADREKCLRATLHAARRSFASAMALPLLHRLVVYASGGLVSEDGKEKSERRMRLAIKIANKPIQILPQPASLTPSQPPLISVLQP